MRSMKIELPLSLNWILESKLEIPPFGYRTFLFIQSLNFVFSNVTVSFARFFVCSHLLGTGVPIIWLMPQREPASILTWSFLHVEIVLPELFILRVMAHARSFIFHPFSRRLSVFGFTVLVIDGIFEFCFARVMWWLSTYTCLLNTVMMGRYLIPLWFDNNGTVSGVLPCIQMVTRKTTL